MSASTFSDLMKHVGHEIECVNYGRPAVNVAVECVTCSVVLQDFDNGKACSKCGSTNVFFDAYVGVNDPEDVRTFDEIFCDDCGEQTSLVWEVKND